MKRISTILCLVLFVAASFWSCQKEERKFIDETDNETITSSSDLTLLLLRTSSNNGLIDDLIDENSCASVAYPFSVIANGQQVLLESSDDIQTVKQIFDQFPNDTDTLELIFPISVVLNDFTVLTVNNEEELQALRDACETGGTETAITCLDLVYNLNFFVYDSNQQQSGTVSVDSDVELYLFIQSLDPENYISIDYPVSVILNDGSTTVVETNSQLQQLIIECVENSSSDPIDQVLFEEQLTTDSWFITYFFDDYDRTAEFDGFQFNFNNNGTASATDGTTTETGNWMFFGGANPQLDLFFGTNTPFDELDESWEILEAGEELVRLRNVSSDGSSDYVTFGRNPATGNANATNTLIEELTTGSWFVTLFDDGGTDETCEYVDYEFTFSLDGSATGESSSNSVDGYWAVDNNNNDLRLILNFDSGGSGNPLGELNDNWDVNNHTINLIQLQDGTGGGADILHFGRTSAPGCGGGGGGGGGSNPQELRDVMQAGTWFVAQFLDNGDDETADFNGYDFTFLSNDVVSAQNGNQSVPGIWIVSVIGNELNFEFDMDSPINGADDDEYKVVQFTDTSVTFVTLNNGMIEDTLIFNKN